MRPKMLHDCRSTRYLIIFHGSLLLSDWKLTSEQVKKIRRWNLIEPLRIRLTRCYERIELEYSRIRAQFHHSVFGTEPFAGKFRPYQVREITVPHSIVDDASSDERHKHGFCKRWAVSTARLFSVLRLSHWCWLAWEHTDMMGLREELSLCTYFTNESW